ncbi:MAG: DUF58 domain-containing protein [Methylococcales bacterium]|nr:DUF58 domain-containing protein [Methylococcales bacterium]
MLGRVKERLLASRFFRGEAPSSAPLLLNHRRIFILPTGHGLVFSVVLLLLLLIAFVYNNNLVYLLTFALVSVYVVSILHCFKALSGLRVALSPVAPVFAGELAHVQLHVDNTHNGPKAHLECDWARPKTVALAAGEQRFWPLMLPTRQRGWLPLPTVTLASRHPFGWFRAWSPLRFAGGVWVYPKPWPEHLPFPDSLDASGAEQGRHRQGVDDFTGLAEYRPGDAIKHIHWQSYAKGAGLYVKQYCGTQSRELWLDYQNTLHLPLEQRLSVLCRWLLEAERQALHYGLKLPGMQRSPATGETHLHACLEALAKF